MDLFNFTKPKELYDERKKKFNEDEMNFSSNPLLDKTDENLRKLDVA